MNTYQKRFLEFAAVAAITRSVLMAAASHLFMTVASLIALAIAHTTPVMTLGLVIATYLIILPPLAALKYDYKPTRLKGRTITAGVVGFGLLAAVLSYCNYLLFFLREQLSPAYVDSALPMYQQATSLALLTLVLCVFVYLLVERAHDHSRIITPHLLSNNWLLGAFITSFVMYAAIAYNPWLQSLFGAQGPGILDWLSAIACAGIFLLIRISQRHTRKHSRKAVLDLHHELRSKR